ncbi:transcriptional regulator [Chryseobacterium sp. Leaf405]|uniref:response regulator n=1 Tax=Chryseobacterium sp. Leaf405 TaxID=1736367 RepID=UPI0006FAAE5C|nr:response regulator [Chryseobacterium sp. Leaf405]KQT25834.1 transcriptional regulator [Chryseobacterium sp. Leaf405]
MTKEYLNVIVVEEDEGIQIFFKSIFADLKIKTKVLFFSDGKVGVDYLMKEDALVPEVLFMNYDFPEKNSLELIDQVKENFRYNKMTTVLYSEWLSEHEIEEIFVKGINVFMKKQNNYSNLKKAVTEIITVNWQYYTSGLNKENFIMKV